MSEHQRLIVAFSHSSPLSWIPAPCLLTAQLAARGGGIRNPIAVMDRFFYSMPLLRVLAEYITQSDRPLRFDELVEHFENLKTADLVVFPEGSNCFFGNPGDLQPFRSNRFVEISMRTGTPILLCVHRGSEHWGLNFQLNDLVISKIDEIPFPNPVRKFFGERLKSGRSFTVPVLPKPMERFSMYTRLYQPQVVDSGKLSQDEWRMAVAAEAENVHNEMKAMLRYLDDLVAKSASEL